MRRDRQDDTYMPPLPPLECGEHIVKWLMDAGPTMPAGMNVGPISYSELLAWQRLAGVDLSPWEAMTLRRLSRDYVGELRAAEKHERAAPWAEGEPVRVLSVVANDMRRQLRATLAE